MNKSLNWFNCILTYILLYMFIYFLTIDYPWILKFPMSSSATLPDPHLKTGGEHLVSKKEAEAVERVSPEALNETKLLKIRRKYRYLVYKIEGNEIVVENVGQRTADVEAFKTVLPINECRYALYDHGK